jgi:hypothetical protein
MILIFYRAIASVYVPFREGKMRVFLIACLAMVILGIGSYFAVSAAQKPSGTAYTTEGARIKQSWSYRRMAKRTGPATGSANAVQSDAGDECDTSTTWKWITVDFGDPANEAPSCS